ncbi:MAG: hypothetical protein ACT4OX_14890 [Actinomycetota bacterium]
MLVEDAARFAIGPLSEVAASTHTWAALSPHVAPGPVAALAAYERVVRGERVDPATVAPTEVLTVPLALQRWEPDYEVATYYPDRLEVPAPVLPRGRALILPEPGARLDDVGVEQAMRDLVRAWTAGSEGEARVVAVEGDAHAAIAALSLEDVRGAWCSLPEAVALLAWAGASGGRHGRRRGAAAGRDLAWGVLRSLLGLEHDETPAEEDADRLRWCVFSARDATSGWILRLAVDDPDERLAWAVDARDQ